MVASDRVRRNHRKAVHVTGSRVSGTDAFHRQRYFDAETGACDANAMG